MTHRNSTLLVVALAGCLGVAVHASVSAAQPAPTANAATAPAVQAAEAWLAMVDGGRFPESWDAAAAFFRSSVPRASWPTMVGGVRGPLGAVRSRRLAGAQAATSLPGGPPGSYVVIQFQTAFANRASSVETVTMMLDGGTWRAAGYFVR